MYLPAASTDRHDISVYHWFGKNPLSTGRSDVLVYFLLLQYAYHAHSVRPILSDSDISIRVLDNYLKDSDRIAWCRGTDRLISFLESSYLAVLTDHHASLIWHK